MCHIRKLIDRLRGVRKAREREFGCEVPLPPSSRASCPQSHAPKILFPFRTPAELIDGNLMQNYCVLLA